MTKKNRRRDIDRKRDHQCSCCTPPRPIYTQALGRRDVARHEADHTQAVPAAKPGRADG